MRLMLSQCTKHARLLLRKFCLSNEVARMKSLFCFPPGPDPYRVGVGPSGNKSLSVQIISIFSTTWKCFAVALLPLLLALFEFAYDEEHKLLSAFISFAILISLAGVGYFCQDSLLFYSDNPENSRVYVQSPPMDLVNAHIVTLVTRDYVTLQAFLLQTNHSPDSAPTIIYFHGNAGNIGHRLPNALEMVLQLKSNILLVEYRGYGKSSGAPTERGLYLDAEAAIDYVRSHGKLDANKIVLFGRSLGGAVAIHAAALHSAQGGAAPDGLRLMIVENTFTHIADVAELMFRVPGFSLIPRILYKNKFASIERINMINMPCLFISGQADQLVPPHMMATLFNKCSAAKKRLLKVRGGTHNETWMTNGYYETIKKFMDEVFSSNAAGVSSLVDQVTSPSVNNATANNQSDNNGLPGLPYSSPPAPLYETFHNHNIDT